MVYHFIIHFHSQERVEETDMLIYATVSNKEQKIKTHRGTFFPSCKLFEGSSMTATGDAL